MSNWQETGKARIVNNELRGPRGERIVRILGYNKHVNSTTPETIRPTGQPYTWPSGATDMEIGSDAGATDDGVQVTTQYLKADYTEHTATVTLDDASKPVIEDVFRINAQWVSNGQDPTDRLFTRVSGGATEYCTIPLGYNSKQMATYTVPSGYYAILQAWHFSVGKGDELDGLILFRGEGGVFVAASLFLGAQGQSELRCTWPVDWWGGGIALPHTDIEMRAARAAGSGNQRCSVCAHVILIPVEGA